MSFRELFPATTWLCERLSSRRARRVYVWGFAIVVIPAIALHVYAALFETRVLAIVHAISQIRVGVSSRDEALARIPALRTIKPDPYRSQCGADECFSAEVSTPELTDSLLRKIGGEHKGALFSILSWWGLRSGYVDVHVELTSGKVSSSGYRLVLVTPNDDYPGLVIVGVSSVQHIQQSRHGSVAAGSPAYSVEPARKAPSQSIGIRLTPQAPIEIVKPAFDPNLRCLWSLSGCRTWHQILPTIEHMGA